VIMRPGASPLPHIPLVRMERRYEKGLTRRRRAQLFSTASMETITAAVHQVFFLAWEIPMTAGIAPVRANSFHDGRAV
jgi:hypothetical protein